MAMLFMVFSVIKLPTERSLERSFQGPIKAEAVAIKARQGRKTTNITSVPSEGQRISICIGCLWIWRKCMPFSK